MIIRNEPPPTRPWDPAALAAELVRMVGRMTQRPAAGDACHAREEDDFWDPPGVPDPISIVLKDDPYGYRWRFLHTPLR